MEFRLIQNIITNIQETINNAAIASVNSLKAHNFSADVKIKNFPKNQKINGIVSVSNQKRVEKELKTNGVTLKTILKWLKAFKMPKSIEVSNFPEPLKPKDFPKGFNVLNFPKYPEFPKNIRVSNQPLKEISDLKDEIKNVKKAIKSLKLDPKISVQAPKPDKVVVPPASVSVTQQEIDYEKLASLIPIPDPFDYEKLADAIATKIAQSVVTIGGGGGRRKEGEDDLTRQYNVSDKDDATAIKYYGFIGRTGVWYILKEDTNSKTYRYVRGSSDYEQNWIDRASLQYGIYSEVF